MTMVNLNYLIKNGFWRDGTAPTGVFRWQKYDGKVDGPYIINRTYSISVTLEGDGTKTLYGVLNFLGDYGYILEHRYFNGAISIADFEKFIDKRCWPLPEIVKSSRTPVEER